MIAFSNIDNTHNYSRKPRPFEPTMSRVDSSAMITNPAEASRSRVTLSNSVCSNQPKGSFIPNEIERSPKEVRHKIGISMALRMSDLEPFRITGQIARSDCILSGKGRIAYNGIKARVLAPEHFCELDFPMKRSEWRFGLAQMAGSILVDFCILTLHRLREFEPLALAFLGLLFFKERNENQVTAKSHRLQERLRFLPLHMWVFIRAGFFTFTDAFTELDVASHRLGRMHHF